MTLGNHEFNFGSDDLQGRPRARRPSRSSAPTSPTPAPTASPTAERQAVRREDRRARGDQGRDPRHHQPPRPQLRAAQQHPRPDLQRPARQGPGARRPTLRADQRRRHRADAHRLHRGPEERRGRQERRHQPGDDRHRARRHHRLPQPHQPGHRVRRLQVPADDRRRPGRHAGGHQPGLSLQQHARRDRPRLARQGRWRLRGRLAGPAGTSSVAMATAEDAATKAIVDPVRRRAHRLQQHGRRPDDGPDRHPRRPSPQETNGANLQADASVFELAQARHHRRRRPPVRRDDQQEDRRRRHARPARSRSRSPTCSRPCRTRTRSSC